MQKNETGPLSHTKYKKNNSKWIKVLKTRKSGTTRKKEKEK